MRTIANRLTSITFYMCGALLVLASNLQGMQELQPLYKIPVNGSIKNVIALGQNNILIHGEKGLGGYYLEEWDIVSGSCVRFYTVNDIIRINEVEVYKIDDWHVMLLPSALGIVRKLDLETRGIYPMFEVPHGKYSISSNRLYPPQLLSNNRIALFNMCGDVEIWDCRTGEFHKSIKHDADSKSTVTSDGHNRIFWLDHPDGTLLVLDIERAIWVDKISIPKRSASVMSMLVLDDDHIALAYNNGLLSMWDLKKKEEYLSVQAHNDMITLMIKLDADHLATGGGDGLAKVWSWKNSECINIITGHQDEGEVVSVLAALPDGRIASGTSKSVQISQWY